MSFIKLHILVILSALLIISGCRKDGAAPTTIHKDVSEAFNSCLTWRNLQEYPLVHAYLDSVFSSNKEIPASNLAVKYTYLADMYINQLNNYNTAQIYLDSADRIGFNTSDVSHWAIVYYFLKGANALEKREYESAFQAYHKGKQYIDSSGEPCQGEAFYQAIAYLHFRQGKFADALNYYKLRRSLYLSCDSSFTFLNAHNELMSINNIGLCFERMGQIDSAISYYDLGLNTYAKMLKSEVSKKHLLVQIYGVILGNKGGCLLKKGELASAEGYLKQSIDINYSPNRDIKDAILTKIKLADLYLQSGKLENCESVIAEITADLEKYPYLLAEQRLSELISRFYNNQHNFEKSLHFLTKSYALKDSLQIRGQSIDAKYDFINEIESLRKEMDIEKLENQSRNKNNLILFISILLVLGFSFVVSLYQKRMRDKRYVQKLKALNKTILENNDILKNSLKALEQSQAENSRIMKILAHDLRSPIAGIVNAIRVLRANHLEIEESQRILELIEKSSINSLDFIDDLLNLNDKTETSEQSEVDISLILETCLHLHRPQAEEKKLNIESTLIPVFVNANPQRIWRVFNNILVNAIKFSKPGDDIHIQTQLLETSVCVSIRDQGIGIPDSMKEKIFDMFSTAGRPGTKGEKSFGLGLAISKQIIESYQGKIWFESEENEGTTFYVELPTLLVKTKNEDFSTLLTV